MKNSVAAMTTHEKIPSHAYEGIFSCVIEYELI
jgi:hypothetical protein